MILPRSIVQRVLPILFLGAGSAALVLAFGARPAAAAAPVNDVPVNDVIEQAMQQINQSVRTLGKGINADNRAAALDELAKVEQALIAAKKETPDTAAAIDEKKRPEFVNEFRSSLLEVLKLTCDAEIAVVNGKYKDAEGILKGKLGSLKSAGHGKFKGEDK
jgi:hypothetical protein